MKKVLLFLGLMCFILNVSAQDIMLQSPTKTGGKPLMDALNERKTHREFNKRSLPVDTLSNLMWAAYGLNREFKRTVPSSQNRQEIDVYVVLEDGIYKYDAAKNKLTLHVSGDKREALGQPMVTDSAALTLVYVADLDKASNKEVAYLDTGFIGQNVYLFCASTDNLGTVTRWSFKRPDLHDALGLSDNELITLVQAVGYIK